MSGPAWSNQVQSQVIVGGPGGGLFVYNGTPAFGNPPVFYVTSASTDPFGNPVTPLAATSQVGGNIVQLINGLVRFPAGGGNGFIGTGTAGVIQLNSGASGGGDSALDVLFRSKNLSTGGAAPAMELPDVGSVIVADEILAWNTGRTAPESWHTLSLAAGWTTAAGHPLPSYRLLPTGDVEMAGYATHAGFTVATALSTAGAVPAAYRPSTQMTIAGINDTTVGVLISASGTVTAIPFSAVTASGVEYSGTYPLNL